MNHRLCAAFVALAVLLSCASITHPERAGTSRGTVDIESLLADCMLLYHSPAVGLVALGVDISDGALLVAKPAPAPPKLTGAGALAH